MRYQQVVNTGAFAKKDELVNGSICKIVSETKPQPSTFTNKDGSPKTQDVCKVKFSTGEAANVSLNRATINGLVSAYGEDSIKWQGHPLTVSTEKMRVGGKAVIALYLIPEGYERIDDDNGYAVIVKMGGANEELDNIKQMSVDDIPVVESESF